MMRAASRRVIASGPVRRVRPPGVAALGEGGSDHGADVGLVDHGVAARHEAVAHHAVAPDRIGPLQAVGHVLDRGPHVRPVEPRRLDGPGGRQFLIGAGQHRDALHPRPHRHLDDLGTRRERAVVVAGQGDEVESGGALERGPDAVGAGQVALDDLDARRQVGRRRSASERPDRVSGLGEVDDDLASDGAGGPVTRIVMSCSFSRGRSDRTNSRRLQVKGRCAHRSRMRATSARWWITSRLMCSTRAAIGRCAQSCSAGPHGRASPSGPRARTPATHRS